MFHNSRSIPQIRAETILEGISRMHYDAVNLAEGELELGASFLNEKLASYPIELVSANVDIKSGQKGAVSVKPYIIKDFGTFRVAVTGIASKVLFHADARLDKNVEITEPLSSLKPILAELKDKADVVILLSHFMLKGTQNFLTYNPLPELSVAVAGHGRNLTKNPEKVGDTLIVQNSMGGEYLSVLTLELDNSLKITSHAVENIPLTDEVPEDEFLQKKLAQFKATESKAQAEKHKPKNVSKEQTEVLKLSPEAFIKRMNAD